MYGELITGLSLVTDHFHQRGAIVPTKKKDLAPRKKQKKTAVAKKSSPNRKDFPRIIQESLTNALKYAQAENINVNLIQKGRKKVLRLSIEDDGRGFEHSDELSTTLEPGHLGITNMRERAVMLGGGFRIESQPGKGTVVIAEIPFGE